MSSSPDPTEPTTPITHQPDPTTPIDFSLISFSSKSENHFFVTIWYFWSNNRCSFRLNISFSFQITCILSLYPVLLGCCCNAFNYNSINFWRPLSPSTSFCSSMMMTGLILLLSGTPAGWDVFTIDDSSLLYVVHWKTLVSHYTHVLRISEFKVAQPPVFLSTYHL